MIARELLKPTEIDTLLRYPRGRAARLAKRGLIPSIQLPDGSIRFDADKIAAWLAERAEREVCNDSK